MKFTRLFMIIAMVGMMVTGCHPPTVEEVLTESYKKCQSVENGRYEMTRLMKYVTETDTAVMHYVCDFRKLPGDSLFGCAFNSRLEYSDGNVLNNLYTGHELVQYQDSTGRVISCELWMEHLQDIKHNFDFFDPLVRENSKPLCDEERLADSAYTFSLKDDRLDGKAYYLVNILGPTWNNEMYGIKGLREETQIWVDKKSYIPIRYSHASDFIMQGDTMHQYEECRLNEFVEGVDTSRLSLQSIPSHIVLKDYTPYKAPEPLKVGEAVPQWTLESLDGETVSFADLRGKIVLIDFFYKSCGPCIAAMPGLQRLYEKYHDKGFAMVGIDPFDDREEVKELLSARGITYTILFSDKKLPSEYHVDGYPNLFLIGREGKLVKLYLGYREDLEERIEEEIVKLLGL